MSPNTWPVIDAGVRALEKGTCLQFVDYTNQRDYIGTVIRFLTILLKNMCIYGTFLCDNEPFQ